MWPRRVPPVHGGWRLFEPVDVKIIALEKKKLAHPITEYCLVFTPSDWSVSSYYYRAQRGLTSEFKACQQWDTVNWISAAAQKPPSICWSCSLMSTTEESLAVAQYVNSLVSCSVATGSSQSMTTVLQATPRLITTKSSDDVFEPGPDFNALCEPSSPYHLIPRIRSVAAHSLIV
jgi:hypothetical protein